MSPAAGLQANASEGAPSARAGTGLRSAPPPDGTSPGELVRRAQQGCQESFGLLVERYGARVVNYLRQMTGNPHDAEDLAQESFLKAFLMLDRCVHREGFLPWVLTIARRAALNHFRARRVTEPIAPEHQVDANDPARLSAERDEHRLIWRLARSLKPDQYEALWLHYAEGLPVAQVARIMRRPAICVRVLLHRARRRLAKRIEAGQFALGPVITPRQNSIRKTE